MTKQGMVSMIKAREEALKKTYHEYVAVFGEESEEVKVPRAKWAEVNKLMLMMGIN